MIHPIDKRQRLDDDDMKTTRHKAPSGRHKDTQTAALLSRELSRRHVFVGVVSTHAPQGARQAQELSSPNMTACASRLNAFGR